MTVKERLEREENNLDKIILYADGGKFIRAYNHSAFAFVTRIKEYIVLASLNQALNKRFVHIGFPSTSLEGLLKNYSTEILDGKEKAYTVKLEKPIDPNQYEAWEERMITEAEKRKEEKKKEGGSDKTEKADETARRAQEDAGLGGQGIIDDILSRNILAMTPLDAMSFLADIQTQLRTEYKKERRKTFPFE